MKTVRRPKCPICGQPMISSFAYPQKEYVCVPCGHAEEFLNSCEEIEIEEKYERKLKKKYHDDLKRIAFMWGGAICGACGKRGGNNCPKCEIKDSFKYWGKGR